MGVIRGYVGVYKGLGFPQIRGTFLRDPDDKDYSNYSRVYIRVRIFLGNDLALLMRAYGSRECGNYHKQSNSR